MLFLILIMEIVSSLSTLCSNVVTLRPVTTGVGLLSGRQIHRGLYLMHNQWSSGVHTVGSCLYFPPRHAVHGSSFSSDAMLGPEDKM